MFALMAGMSEKHKWLAGHTVATIGLHTMVRWYYRTTCPQKSFHFLCLLPILVSTASSYMFLGDGPLYHNAMCNGGEETFGSCQLPRPDTVASCPSVAAVNCYEC